MERPEEFLPTKRHSAELGVIALTALVLWNPLEISVSLASLQVSPEAVKGAVLSLGVWAPIGMVFFEWLQVVVAFIPPVTMVASGYTFGAFWGSIYSFIGMSLGSITAIFLGRRYGKKIVERFISDDHMKRFERLTREHGLIVFAVVFLLPGFPKDPACYIAGLTDIDLKKLMATACIARIPVMMMLVLTGNSIAAANTKFIAAVLGSFIAISLISVRYEERIIGTASGWESRMETFIFRFW